MKYWELVKKQLLNKSKKLIKNLLLSGILIRIPTTRNKQNRNSDKLQKRMKIYLTKTKEEPMTVTVLRDPN